MRGLCRQPVGGVLHTTGPIKVASLPGDQRAAGTGAGARCQEEADEGYQARGDASPHFSRWRLQLF